MFSKAKSLNTKNEQPYIQLGILLLIQGEHNRP
jgi:hypothetical protein